MATTIIKSATSDNQALVDSTGHLYVTMGGGGGGTDVNLTEVGGAPIAEGQATSANSIPVVIASDQSPIPITGTITATNPSVGMDGATAPTSATEIGAVNASGNLQALQVDPAGRLLVDISGTSTITGTVNADILGLTAFQTSQYSIGTTAVQITPTPLTNRSSMTMKVVCTGSNIIYVGNSSAVTTATGYPLFNGDSLQMDLTPAQTIYAIATLAGQKMYVLEIA